MKSFRGGGLVWVGIVSLAICGGCDPKPDRVKPVDYQPARQSNKAMDLFDVNKDGKISGTELDKAPGLKAALTILGAGKDKAVTQEQIKNRIQKWKDSIIGRMTVNCTVTRNGNPLEGATIKFVPEQFLADDFKGKDGALLIGIGKTNGMGSTTITWPTTPGPNGDPSGIGPGIYKIEVTKDGEPIPTKYNTATVLGQEISQDNIELQRGLKYNLSY
jgi:hypothetical protein